VLGGEGFTIPDMDEAFFIYDVASGRKYWFSRGERIVVPYTGNHRRIVVYGAIAKDGRQLFRTRELFDTPTFVWCLKELQRRFGKAAVVMDGASPHHTKTVKKLLRENKNIKIIYLSKGSPYLNAIEECWRQGKQVLLVSEYYRTFADLCNAIITYYRTVRFKLDIFKFAQRRQYPARINNRRYRPLL
jgi:transposase